MLFSKSCIVLVLDFEKVKVSVCLCLRLCVVNIPVQLGIRNGIHQVSLEIFGQWASTNLDKPGKSLLSDFYI